VHHLANPKALQDFFWVLAVALLTLVLLIGRVEPKTK
jgi:hypothetical protein